jgi:hypothetical protein
MRQGVAAISTALAVCSGIALCAGCARTSATGQTVTVTTSQPATVAPALKKHRTAHVSFSLPSHNIVCEMSNVVACRVLSAGNQLYILTANGKAHVSPRGRALALPSGVLAYGLQRRHGSFVCRSAFAGLYCRVDGQTTGMFLSRQRQDLSTRPPSTKVPKTSPPPQNTRPADKDFVVEDLIVKDDGLGDIGGIARLTNTASTSLTVTFTFTFFQNGQIVGTAEGSANDVAPGQTVTANLVSQDPLMSGHFQYQFQVDTEF